MLHPLSALTLTLLPLVYAQDNNTATVLSALQASKVIPDVIPPDFTPRLPLDVVFTANDSTFPVTAGAHLTKAQTANIPSFALLSNNNAIIGKPYLMAIVDPDAPTPQNPTSSQFRHFLAADYISDKNTNGEFILTNQSKTATLTDYTPPSPPSGSDPHRYVVLCYLQNSTGVSPPSDFNVTSRTKFNITQFVGSVQADNNMTLIGATFFFVSPNDTTGSVKPNSSSGSGPPAPTGSPSATGKPSDAAKLSVPAACAVVGILAALSTFVF